MPTSKLCIRLGTVGVRACVPCEHTTDQLPAAVRRTVDRVAQALHKAGKISDLCEGAGFFERLTLLERQFPSASVLVHKQGVLPPEIAALWTSPQLMSAARQFLGGACCWPWTLSGRACCHAWVPARVLEPQVWLSVGSPPSVLVTVVCCLRAQATAQWWGGCCWGMLTCDGVCQIAQNLVKQGLVVFALLSSGGADKHTSSQCALVHR